MSFRRSALVEFFVLQQGETETPPSPKIDRGIIIDRREGESIVDQYYPTNERTMDEGRRGCGSRSTASGSTAKSFLFFFEHSGNLERKSLSLLFRSLFFFFFFFGLHGATNFFYSIGFLYFAPPSRPPLYFFFSGHVKIFARRLCDNRRRHRTTSLYIFFSSFRLLLPPPTPYHTFATTLLFIF